MDETRNSLVCQKLPAPSMVDQQRCALGPLPFSTRNGGISRLSPKLKISTVVELEFRSLLKHQKVIIRIQREESRIGMAGL